VMLTLAINQVCPPPLGAHGWSRCPRAQCLLPCIAVFPPCHSRAWPLHPVAWDLS
jgi:hypothetical protein